MIANTLSPSARLGASLAAGALAFTAFAGTGLAMGSSAHVGSFNTSQFHGMSLTDICDDLDDFNLSNAMEDRLEDLCGQVNDFEDMDCSCGNWMGSLDIGDWHKKNRLQNFGNDCNGVGGHNANDFDDFADAFEDLFGGVKSASVNANANTTVNNEINAGSVNDVSVNQGGGLASASVDADANTTVNNEINAASQNTVNVSQ
jgi:hypothetical protein